jgi:hypothetical protein
MNLKKIKEGSWVETNVGVGKVRRVGGTFPVSVQVSIFVPFPRGLCNVFPRHIARVIEAAELARYFPKEVPT